jgi:hypothetical protein
MVPSRVALFLRLITDCGLLMIFKAGAGEIQTPDKRFWRNCDVELAEGVASKPH